MRLVWRGIADMWVAESGSVSGKEQFPFLLSGAVAASACEWNRCGLRPLVLHAREKTVGPATLHENVMRHEFGAVNSTAPPVGRSVRACQTVSHPGPQEEVRFRFFAFFAAPFFVFQRPTVRFLAADISLCDRDTAANSVRGGPPQIGCCRECRAMVPAEELGGLYDSVDDGYLERNILQPGLGSLQPGLEKNGRFPQPPASPACWCSGANWGWPALPAAVSMPASDTGAVRSPIRQECS